MNKNSCDINDKGKSCCSTSSNTIFETNLKEHWDKIYLNSSEDKLGWYETDISPTLSLINKTDLDKNTRVLIIGAGSTTLVDELLNIGYSNLTATDLSDVALTKLENRLNTDTVEFIVDDLSSPTALKDIAPVDLWIDRAVLHFFTKKNDQDSYFNLLNNKVKRSGFVLLAEYNLNGTTKCAGLPVHRYSKEMLVEKLGAGFDLVNSFDYTYITPSGAERLYIYTLFRKK